MAQGRAVTAFTVLGLVLSACGGDGGTTSTEVSTTTTLPAESTTSTTATTTTTMADTTTTAEASGVDTPVGRFIEAFASPGDCFTVAYVASEEEYDYSAPPRRVDCSEPHDQEVFFAGELDDAPDSPYPGIDAVADRVFIEECAGPFEDTFGTPFERVTSLEFWATFPFEAEWDAGLRTFACAVATTQAVEFPQTLVGTAASSGATLPGHLAAAIAEFDQRDIHVWIYGEDGEVLDVVNLTADHTDLLEQIHPPSWSPDNSSIVYAAESPDGNNDIYVVDVATGEKTNLTNHPAGDFAPEYSPDGTQIVFSSGRDSADSNIFVMDADGSNVAQLTFQDDRASSPDWSPDGTRIAYRQRIDGNSDIWVMDADGSNQRFLVGGPANEYDPAWSPDGTQLAFISDVADTFDIWVFPAEGLTILGAPPSLTAAGATLVSDHPANDEHPTWTPDSNSIVFLSDRHGNQNAWIMGADGSDPSLLIYETPVAAAEVVLHTP